MLSGAGVLGSDAEVKLSIPSSIVVESSVKPTMLLGVLENCELAEHRENEALTRSGAATALRVFLAGCGGIVGG